MLTASGREGLEFGLIRIILQVHLDLLMAGRSANPILLESIKLLNWPLHGNSSLLSLLDEAQDRIVVYQAKSERKMPYLLMIQAQIGSDQVPPFHGFSFRGKATGVH